MLRGTDYTVRYGILSKLHSLSQQLPASHNGLRLSHPPTRGVSTSQGKGHPILGGGEVEKGRHRWPAIGYLHLLPCTPSPYGSPDPGRACPNLPFIYCTQFGSLARRPNWGRLLTGIGGRSSGFRSMKLFLEKFKFWQKQQILSSFSTHFLLSDTSLSENFRNFFILLNNFREYAKTQIFVSNHSSGC